MLFPRQTLLFATLLLMGLFVVGYAAERPREVAGKTAARLIGTWYSADGTVIFKENGTVNYRGTGYYYAVANGMIQLGGRHGMTMIPYQRTEGKLVLTVNGKKTVYSAK